MGEDRSATEQRPDRRRVTVAEAAEILGITAEAVRTRIKRGKLDSVKEPPGHGGTVYVLLEVDPTRPNIDPTSQGQDQTDDQIRGRNELVEALREQVRHLQGIIATRDKELEQRSEEIRRRDAALEREQELTAMFATRLGELEGPQDERPREQSAPATPETEQEDSPLVPDATFSKWTLLLSVIGVGIVAGVANPLMMRLLEDPLWVALSVLWVPLPVLGALLGSVLAKRAAEIVDRLSTFVKQLEDERRAGKIDEGRVAAYEDRYLRERERLQSTKALLPLYTLVVGIVTATSSVGTFWFVLGPATTSVLLREASGVALAQGVFAAMFVGFGSLIGRGRVRERHETARTVAREGGSAEIKAANQQATFGLVGTIITAVLALVGTLIQVFGG